MKKAFIILICLVGLLSCYNSNTNSNSIKEETIEEDLELEEEIAIEDTLRLTEGKIPEDWVQISLSENGYYIGFPKEPTQKERRSSHRIDIKLKRSKYRMSCNLTDLSEELSFKENKKYRTAYYTAIVEDLAEGIEGTVKEQTTFYSQSIYEGTQATIVAEDVRIYLRCVIIESVLYTISLTLFDEEKPAYMQLRDKFFYSFGNEFYSSKSERNLQKDTLE